MAGIKISDLPAASSAQLTDVFPVDQGATTYKESNSQLLTLFQANGQALTRTNDTNVTMTLGGSPATSLLNAASMTLGWSGQLSVPRGGTGNSTFTAYSVICAGTTATGAFQNVSGLGNAGEQLTSNGPGALPTWQPSSTVTPAALTKTDDTNVTLTLGGTPATALLQTTSITAGWTGTLSGTRGGTGVNNGASTLTLGGSLTTSGAFASTFTMTGVTTVTFPTSGTLATTSQIPTGAALTKTDDTNVTLTLGGTPATALLQATSITTGWTGTLSGTRGGTGVNNGASTITLGGSLTTSGAFLSTFTMTGVTTVTFPTSGTLATTSQLVTPAALTKTDDTNVTLTLGGSPTTALVNAASITAGWTGQLGLTRGGTNASLTASNGGIVWSNATQLQVLAGTATAGQILQSGSSATPSWSTTTYPATNAINTLLFASAANTMSALATANRGVLVTSNTGVPSILGSAATTGQLLQSNAAAAPSYSTTTYPATNVINTLLFASAANVMSALATANRGVLVTSNTGVPSILGSAATTGQILQSNAAAAPSYSTTTYPATNAINTIMFASSANVLGSIAAANSSVLVSSAGGVPSMSTTLPNINIGTPTAGVLTNTTGGGGLRSFQLFTSGTAATYTKPANVTSILIEAIGGGGGGGGIAITTGGGAAAGGGGGGGYCRLWVAAAAATYTYTVGPGGAGGTAGNNNGTSGTATTFVGTGANIAAGGGQAGLGAPNSTVAALSGAQGAGGTATGGDINIVGGVGGYGMVNGAAGAGMAMAGFGGGTTLAPTTPATPAAASGGAASANSGCGGSGAGTQANGSAFAGGAGAAGRIIVWEFS
jgi:hypothetical protein